MSVKEDVLGIKKEINQMQEQSFAKEILHDYKKSNKRLFTILIIVLLMWFTTGCYLVYTLNGIGTIDTTVTQENENGYNNYIGNDGDITNGETNDKN